MRAPLPCILAVLLLAALTPPTSAASRKAARDHSPPAPPPGPELEAGINWESPPDRVRTLRDLDTIHVKSSLEEFRDFNRELIGSVTPQKVTVAAALAAARAQVDPDGKGTLLAALRARPELQTPEALRALAADAFANAKPGVTLAALVVADERRPRDPEIRFDLASLLAWHGLVNEADALLDDLAAAGGGPGHAFGIQPQEGTDYLRAYVRMRQGKTGDAMALLKPIAAANPYFSEALLTLALLEAEAGQDATQHYLMGVFHRPVPRPPAAEGSDTTASGQTGTGRKSRAEQEDADQFELEAPLFVDMSKGLPGDIPQVKQPIALEDRIAYVDWAKEKMPALNAEAMALGMARDQAGQRRSAKQLPKALRHRLVEIERMIDPSNARLAEIRQLNKAIDRAIVDKTDTRERLMGEFSTKWAGLMPQYVKDPASVATQVKEMADGMDTTMRAQTQLVDELTRRRVRIWHRYATALGALTADPDFHAYLSAQIKLQEQNDYFGSVANTMESCTFADTVRVLAPRCLQPPHKLGDELEKTGEADTAKCSEEDSKKSLGVEGETGAGLGKVENLSFSAEASCDGFSLEASGEVLGMLGVSAELEFKTDKTCTLYVGPKLSSSSGFGIGSKETSTKTGLYLTMNNESFTDVGVRSVVKETGKIGGLGFNVTASQTIKEGHVSFLPGPEVPARGETGMVIFNGQPQ